MKKLIYTFVFLFLSFFVFSQKTWAIEDTPTPTPSVSVTPTQVSDNSQKITDLQNKIKEYEDKVKELQGTKKTLSTQIAIMNNQISLTELKIKETEKNIEGLQKDIDITKRKVDGLEKNISSSTNVLVGRIGASYKTGLTPEWQMFLTADSLSNFFNRLKYLRIVQVADKKKIYASEQAKVNYENQQSVLVKQQDAAKQLEGKLNSYNEKLGQEKTAKQQLLSVTANDEDKYQKLLNQAKAQISAFRSFASSAGGAQILPAQASPDGWYYNQRDERWGRNTIGGSSDQVWDVGCLITATAMVLKQKGVNVTPSDIASDSSNFFSDTAYMLIPWIGGKFQSVWQADLNSIDSRLSNGDVVIVGVRAGVYGQHFIVLKSGSGGNYIMNDPWYGANLNFSDHYTTSQIFQYGYYKG